ncbi:MAG TPA: DUF5305 family protein [Thermoplasmata archaeon]|nr:DUF5305 family protein [Thermoplasmata archaeon]
MKLPLLPRWVSPVAVVLLVLLTVWAAYNFSREATASSPSSPGPTWAYSGLGSYGYVAHLKSNSLFNTTNVTDTNLTLFVSITKTINVTFTDLAAVAPSAAVGIHDNFTVSILTTSWSKTIAHTAHENTSANATGLSLVDRYSVNVSQVEALVSSIDTELNYSATLFTVRLASTITGGVAGGGVAGSLDFASALNLTFRGAQIVPSGAPAAVHETLIGAAGASDPRDGPIAIAGGELAAAGVALALGVWYLREDRRRLAGDGLPDLDHLIEPFEEVIARTTRPPQGATIIPMDAWDDLVKVADTLGRPILWPLGGPNDPVGSDFFVSDGPVAYLYHYPEGPDAEVGPSPGAASSPPSSTPAAAPPPAPRVPPTPVDGASSAGPPAASPRPIARSSPAVSPASPPRADRLPPALARELAEEIKFQLGRTRDAHLDSAQRWYIYSLFTRAARKITQPDPEEARRAVAELRRTIDRSIEESRRAG